MKRNCLNRVMETGSWRNLTVLMYSIYHTWLIRLESLARIAYKAAPFFRLLGPIFFPVSSAK